MTDARKTLNSWWDSLFLEVATIESEDDDGFRDGGVDENGEMCEDEDIDVTE